MRGESSLYGVEGMLKWNMAVVVAGLALVAGPAHAAPAGTQPATVDIELAFDTTGSMQLSIEQAQRDAATLIEAVRGVIPGGTARFAVVSFTDPHYEGAEYEVLQPLTSDTGAVTDALAKLKAHDSVHPENVDSEAYNLAFNKSYTDPTLGWGAGARKIVVVIGDAEPHGAGTEGIPGCTDQNPDTHGLSTRKELAGMRAAGRTLLMIRQVSASTDSFLECYRSLAALAAPGSAALNGGSANLTESLLELLRASFGHVQLTPSLPVAVPRGRTTFTLRFANPNRFPLEVPRLAVNLPTGLTYLPGSARGAQPKLVGRTLVWTPTAAVAPSRTLVMRFSVTAGRATGKRTVTAVADLKLPTGQDAHARGFATLRVAHGLRAALALRATRTAVRGSASLVFAPRARTPLGTAAASGTVTVTRTGATLRLQVTGARVVSLHGPSVVELRVQLLSVAGSAGCRAEATGSLRITDASLGTVIRGSDSALLRLPGCGFALKASPPASVALQPR